MRIPYKMRQKENKKSFIPHLSGLRYYIDTFFENLLMSLTPLPARGLNTQHRKETITVSLTSYPERIDKAYTAIKSLMLQSVKADRIILWLAEEQFRNLPLPAKIKKLIGRGLTVKFVEDIKSHKKYYYALQQQFPGEVVITYDDDIIYERDSIKKLVLAHEQFPDCIVCNRGHEIIFDEKGIKPYGDWKIRFEGGVESPAMNIMPSTGNGCLYPFGVMPESTFDLKSCKENALTADDIWMRFNSILNKIYVVRTQNEVAALVNVYGSQTTALRQVNDEAGENQNTVDKLKRFFPDIENILIRDKGYNSDFKIIEYENAYYSGSGDNRYAILVRAKNPLITNCKIHEKTEKISDNAFRDCKELKKITIPQNVAFFGKGVFMNCDRLKRIAVGKNNKKYGSIGNCLIDIAKKTLVAGCKNSVIPTDGSVTNIEEGAFENCRRLKKIIIPDSVKSVGKWAFYGCENLKLVKFCNGVLKIQEGAFEHCRTLKRVIIPESMHFIDRYAFACCDCLTCAEVKSVDGWTVSKFGEIGKAVAISRKALTDASTAAAYFANTYSVYSWTKNKICKQYDGSDMDT